MGICSVLFLKPSIIDVSYEEWGRQVSFAERVKEISSIVLTGAERRGVGKTDRC